MKSQKADIDKLIEAYLGGKLSNEGFVNLKKFISKNSENLSYFDNYKKMWKPGSSPKVDQKWEDLRSKLLRGQILEKQFKPSTRLYQTIFRIAGVLVIGMILGIIINTTFHSLKNNKDRFLVFTAPKGEKSFVLLPDSTKVWLNGGSMITLTPNYGWTNRKISLTGEAYFEVAKNKRRPFIISTEEVKVKVLGTKFNISAYSDQNEVITTLKEGVIELSSISEDAFKAFTMHKNQMAVFDRSTSKMRLSLVDVETIIAWKENQLIIENEHYLKVFKKLGNWYGVSFIFENNPQIPPNYSMKVKTESLREILEIISVITPIHYQIEGNEVHIVFKEN